MTNERWTYQVAEVKPGFFGFNRNAVQERLNQLGAQGWELVTAVQSHPFRSVMLFLKRSV